MGTLNARVDERLIHGQVATIWTHLLDADRIIVVNNEAVHDKLQIGALKLAKPTGVKLSILSVEKGILNINNGKYADDNCFLITRNIQDMKTLIDGGIPLTAFNVGNIAPREGSHAIKKSVALTEDDVQALRTLLADGIKITAQMVPTESDASIETYLK
ncbi:PTS system mannose/fructose/N-acetylgalactosamine-transporter subunit IIB [Lactiplantibacillus fabifermentans]|uniref:PTS family mannose fructose sorbose porter, IIB component n=2 Tax=Lactiplantibacillus fabifermentans TaxID=483011 RepID=A0A0R2NUV2_9LACO|nr:PTS sugar transporter subunit IIB [Lactiplantibacillus fabifermentans]ETY72984.1 PTS mannose transporter subunit IID [Lactiplantibacillus fabifermentans T30PCM01]KRO28530.1 PTS family mannose fructose sorbose porter, IIB component [Lactiplantibacillus fabifermentans DSM 21115]